MKKTATFVAAGVTAIALAGGVTAGIASADPTTPAPAPSATASPTPGPTPTADKQADKQAKKQAKKSEKGKVGANKHSLLARAMHGEVTVGGKQPRVVVFQRGTVDKVSATEITVKSRDGYTVTYVVGAKTKVKKQQADATIADVQQADKVRVVAARDGSTVTAKIIADKGAK